MSVEAWNRLTADRHERFRADHSIPSGDVAIVCVSNRPHCLGDVLANVRRQRDVDAELVLVPNGDGWNLDAAAAALGGQPGARIVEFDGSASLGAALNAGLAATNARFVAKFDDDDHYGPSHVADSLRVHGFARAAIVGKHSYYATVAGHRVLRFAGREFAYSSTLAGGTLVIDRDRTGDLSFEDVSLGEDRAFIHACHRRGLSSYAGDRFNFVQHRGDDNTWKVDDHQFLAGCVEVDPAATEHDVDR